MNCLNARAERIGGGTLRASLWRQFVTKVTYIGDVLIGRARLVKEFQASAQYSRAFTCRVGLICSTGIRAEDVLWASDGIVLNVYGEKIYLTIKS